MANDIVFTGGEIVRAIPQLPRVTSVPLGGNAMLVRLEDVPDDEEVLFEFDPQAEKATRLDYELAAVSGVLTGALNVLWQKDFDLEGAKEWGDEKVGRFVLRVAKSAGMEKKGATLEDAIRFLEKEFPLAADKLSAEFGGGLQHHLRDFSHHPSLVGLACSILSQFTGKGYGTDTAGKFAVFDLPAVAFDPDCPLVGRNVPEKIALGTLFWAMHLVSDMAGSSSNPGKGTGIPGVVLSLLKELSSLPIFQDVQVSYKGDVIPVQQWISKLFNGTALRTEDGKPIRFDLRAEVGLLDQALRQVPAVVANEVIVRCLYMLTRLKDELERCKAGKVSDLRKLKPSHFMPYNSRALTRMVTVSSTSFVLVNLATAAVRAGIECKGSKVVFAQKLFLRISYAGVGRLAFAVHADWGYMAEEVSEAWAEHSRRRQDVFDGFRFYSLDGETTRIAFSLKLAAVEHDCRNEKNEERKEKKLSWACAWRESVAEGLCVGPEDYFLSSDEACRRLEAISREQGGRVHALLVAQELLDFCPYQQLGTEEDKEFKRLKERASWVKDVFPKMQDAVDASAICSLEERCKARTRDLSGTTRKLLIGGAVVVLLTGGAAGAAAAFAPEIAVGLFGGSFAGLNGIALTNASLAMAGGGALAAGGLGMAGGTALITGGGAALGFLGSGGIALAASMGKDYARFMLVECSRLLAFLDVATERCPHEAAALVQKASEAVQRSIVGLEEDVEKEKSKGSRKDGKLLKRLNKGLKYSTSTLEQIGKLQKRLGAADEHESPNGLLSAGDE
ncbi:hypothetical protein [Paratractidigestivibacter sp.]|uniref:hypothetical protein n=1 Tax=Paratractidigestivibacter sp. TaxID=2847316 RepID=UPI002AC8FD32|nr:hypothetical protein [Paratractidigestivibacter sp.]